MIKLDEMFCLDGFSVGSEETCLWLKSLDVIFDIGRCHNEVLPLNRLLLSHAHMDHCGGLPYYVGQRTLLDLPPCKIYLPCETVEPFRTILTTWEKLEDSRYSYELIGVESGKRYNLSKLYYFMTYPVLHRIPCFGYVIFDEKTKLKSEYVGLTDDEIVKLRKANADIFTITSSPIFAYMGDCEFKTFLENPVFRESRYVVMECTFLDEKKDVAHAQRWKHIHLDEICASPDAFAKVEKLVLIHFSRRYHREYAEKLIRQKCPPELYAKIILI